MCLCSFVGLLLLLNSGANALVGRTPVLSRRGSSSALHSAKDDFLQSLLRSDTLNEGTKERTILLNEMIDSKRTVDVQTVLSDGGNDLSAQDPGSLSSILPIAPGVWKVVYAPHMTTIAKLAGNLALDVTYIMYPDQTIVSHATFSDPLPRPLHLSVSGTYDSVSDTVCLVEWTEAWIKSDADDDVPYATIDDVPDSWVKEVITRVGRLLFIRPFSIFPVSYLANDLTVFDFELLGTRICAKKQ